MCCMLATMRPLMEQCEKHKPFLCKECARREIVERRSVRQALPVLRLVRLYAHVKVQGGSVAMRSVPMHIRVHSPQDDTVWGIGHEAPELSVVRQANPIKCEMLKATGFSYDERESQNIWMYATHIQNFDDH